MRLVSTSLRNFGVHDDLTINWHEGTNILVGGIGAGKTTVLDASCYALTREFLGSGIKGDHQRLGSSPEDPSYVELVVEHQGQSATLVRHLNCSRQSLALGTHVYSSDREVQAELERWLGVSSRLISDHVFVPQWGLFAFLVMADTARSDFFNRLFALEHLKKLHTRLGELVGRVPAVCLDAQRQQAREEVARIEEEVKLITLRVEELLAFCPEMAEARYSPDGSREAKLLAAAAERDLQLRRRQELEEEAHSLSGRMREIGYELGVASEGESQEELELLEKRRERLHQELQRAQELDALASQIEMATARLKECVPPRRPPELLEDRSQLQEAMLARQRLERVLAGLDSGRAECPECGTPTSLLMEKRDHYQQELDSVAVRLEHLQACWQNNASYQNRLSQHTHEHAVLTDRLTVLRRQQATLQVAPVAGAEVLQAELAACLPRLQFLHAQRGRQAALRAEQTRLLGLYQIVQDRLHALADLSAPIAAPELAAATARLEQLRVLWPDYLRLSERLLSRRQELDRAGDRLASLMASLAAEKARLACLQQLEALRGVFHRHALPADLALLHCEALSDHANELLDIFGLAYRLRIDDQLRYRVGDSQGRERAASSLSGGEKMLVALAFRVAVHVRFASQTGLLVLDEPTAGLDRESLGCLERAFGYLRQLSAAGGLQLIVVTHEESLESWFDRTHHLASLRGQ